MKKLFALLALLVLASCQLALSPSELPGSAETDARALTDPVKLYFAKLGSTWSTEGQRLVVKGFVEVADLAYDKSVVLWYQIGTQGLWQEAPAYFLKKHYDKEVWRFDLADLPHDPLGNFTLNFALRYRVKGQEYWDNNQGKNYSLWVDAGTSREANVVLGRSLMTLGLATAYIYPEGGDISAFVGSVYIKNSDPQAKVSARFTQDGWKTTQEAPGILLPPDGVTPEGVQHWQFYSSDILSSTTHIEFALSYTSAGMTVWDNNFGYGSNYHIYRPLGEVRGSDEW